MIGKKYEKPLFIDMDFEEALRRFGTTNKKEVDVLLRREKQRKKAGKAKDPPGKSVDRKDDGG